MPPRLIEKLHAHARQRPHDIAIRQIIPATGQTLTWGGLAARVNDLARLFIGQFPADSVLMLCSGNRPQYTAMFLAALQAGMTVFPVAPDMAAPELISAGQRSGAAALVAVAQPAIGVGAVFSTAASLHECGTDTVLYSGPSWPVRQGRGPALLLLSSGTTGQPRIVRRDADSLDAACANMVEAIGFTSADRVLAAVPLCHSYGMEHGLLCPIWGGGCAHLYERFDLPAAMDEMIHARVTVFPGVPFMFESMCGAAEAPSRALPLRRAYSAGGPLPKPLFQAFLAKFGVAVSQLYGATEIGSVTYNDPAIHPFDPASVGRPMRDVSMRILNASNPNLEPPLDGGAEGHIAIAAPSMLSEYLDGDPPPLLNGYFLTGDLGRIDKSGALCVTGRIKLLIDVGGRKVNPLEVEEVLASHPTVGECVVVPLRMSETLYRLKAIITPARTGSAPIDSAALRAFARARLSAYKVPRVFEIRATLPRSPAGKIQRHLLEEENKSQPLTDPSNFLP